MTEVLYCLLAGGRGERLKPLTNERPKPLVRFGAAGRIIDFTLYNCLASGNGDCIVLTQYLSEMMEHFLRANWSGSFQAMGRRLEVMSSDKSAMGRYLGTADAVRQALSRMEKIPSYIVVLAGDHIYHMDYNSMIEFHLAHGGAATIGAVECERGQAHRFGIIKARGDGKINGFHEKPKSLDDIIPFNVGPIASMGIYVFTTRALLDYFDRNSNDRPQDFGRDVMPKMATQGEAWAYSFRTENGGPAYWRDIGEIEAYLEASMEVLNGHGRELRFENIPGLKRIPFSRELIVKNHLSGKRRIKRSMVARSARIEGAVIEDSIIGPDVHVQDGAIVKKSVLLDGALVQKHAELVNAVVEPYIGVGAGWKSSPSQVEALKRTWLVEGVHFPFFRRAHARASARA